MSSTSNLGPYAYAYFGPYAAVVPAAGREATIVMRAVPRLAVRGARPRVLVDRASKPMLAILRIVLGTRTTCCGAVSACFRSNGHGGRVFISGELRFKKKKKIRIAQLPMLR